MKTKEEYQKAIDEIKEVCKKHNIAIFGTCYSEGIHGEIAIIDSDDSKSCGWGMSKDGIDNTLYTDDGFYVFGIGKVNFND